MVELPLVGGCQCGALRYEITAPPQTIYNCHCTNCQKISGSAFATVLMMTRDDFAFTSGEPMTTEWTATSGKQRFGWFCGSCGSRIAHGTHGAPDDLASKVLSVRAGTLDDTSWVRPVGDGWTRSAQPWVSIPQDRRAFEKQPDDYPGLVAAFAAQKNFG